MEKYKLSKYAKKAKLKSKLWNVLLIVIASLFVLALLALGSLEVYLWVKYANTPVGEIPAWVLWLMWRK